MNKIITISREFGSGGREIGRRLAERLNFAYYDQEIVIELAKRTHYSEEYIKQVEESRPIPLMPITTGRTLTFPMYPLDEQSHSIFIQQNNIIKEMAGKSNCVIVGRCADYILNENNPFRLFIYSDIENKIGRCREKGEFPDNLTDKELKQKILSVDKKRSKYYKYYTDQIWGDKSNYNICINTANLQIVDIVDLIADFANKFYGK